MHYFDALKQKVLETCTIYIEGNKVIAKSHSFAGHAMQGECIIPDSQLKDGIYYLKNHEENVEVAINNLCLRLSSAYLFVKKTLKEKGVEEEPQQELF